jgi:hypothetical protein
MSSAYDDLEQRHNWTGQTKGKGTTNYQSSAEKDCGLVSRKVDLAMAERIIASGQLKMVVATLKRKYPHTMRHLPDEPTAEQLAPALLYHHRHFDPPCELTG